MKYKAINNKDRHKAFIGAAIGTVANIAGGIIGGVKKKKAAREQAKEQNLINLNQNAVDAGQQAQVMSSAYSNQDYVDEAKNKISLKNGGKVKGKDRIEHVKQYSCGGRRKANFGSIAREGLDAANGVNGLMGNIINKPKVEVANLVKPGYAFNVPKTRINQTSYNMNDDNNAMNNVNDTNIIDTRGTIVNPNNPKYKDLLSMARMGKRICKK